MKRARRSGAAPGPSRAPDARISALRTLLGPAPSTIALETLLRDAGGEVEAAADLYFERAAAPQDTAGEILPRYRSPLMDPYGRMASPDFDGPSHLAPSGGAAAVIDLTVDDQDEEQQEDEEEEEEGHFDAARPVDEEEEHVDAAGLSMPHSHHMRAPACIGGAGTHPRSLPLPFPQPAALHAARAIIGQLPPPGPRPAASPAAATRQPGGPLPPPGPRPATLPPAATGQPGGGVEETAEHLQALDEFTAMPFSCDMLHGCKVSAHAHALRGGRQYQGRLTCMPSSC